MGGKSKRFGSIDKGTYKLYGKPLISYQLDTLSRFNTKILLVTRSKTQVQDYLNSIDYEKITAFIIDDLELLDDSNIFTPLIGLYSIFKELSRFKEISKVFIISCDMPLIKYEILDLILKSCDDYDCCIPRWKNGYLEPLFAIYPIEKGLKAAKEMLKKKDYKLLGFFERDWNIHYISVEKEIKPLDRKLTTFININEMNDLNKIKRILSNKA